MEDRERAMRITMLTGLYQSLGFRLDADVLQGTLRGTADLGVDRLRRGVDHLLKTWAEPRFPRAGDIRKAVRETSAIGTFAGTSREERPEPRRVDPGAQPKAIGSVIEEVLGAQERTPAGRKATVELLRQLLLEDKDIPHRVRFYEQRLRALGEAP